MLAQVMTVNVCECVEGHCCDEDHQRAKSKCEVKSMDAGCILKSNFARVLDCWVMKLASDKSCCTGNDNCVLNGCSKGSTKLLSG